MFLAILLIAALALNVSAADAENLEIGGYQYYCSLNCKTSSATGTTQTLSTETKVGVYVKLFDNGVKVVDGGVYNRNQYAGVTVSHTQTVDYATAEHKLDGSTFYQTMDYAP